MVDTVQNLVGTTSSVVVPESSSAPQVSTGGVSSSAEIGVNAPVVGVTDTDTASVNVDSAMRDVMLAMRDMPPPIDLEAVQRLKSEIANNQYPVDYDKISEALISSLNEIV